MLFNNDTSVKMNYVKTSGTLDTSYLNRSIVALITFIFVDLNDQKTTGLFLKKNYSTDKEDSSLDRRLKATEIAIE
jgi:hypothetical protein